MFRRYRMLGVLMSLIVPAVAFGKLPTLTNNSPTAAPETITRTYPVADLIDWMNLDGIRPYADDRPADCVGLMPPFSNPPLRVYMPDAVLVDLIRDTVAPASWKEMGGPGSVLYFPLGMALVVVQTADRHAEIESLLAALRRLQDVEVAVEHRILKVSDEAMARLFGDDVGPDQPDGTPRTLMLNDVQVFSLLEQAQGDAQTSITQAPKATLFNSQRIPISVMEQKSFVTDVEMVEEDGKVVMVPKKEVVDEGWKFVVQPVASADRKSVRLSLQATLTHLDPTVPQVAVTSYVGDSEAPMTVETWVQKPQVTTLTADHNLTIPDGQTAVFFLGKVQEDVRREFRPPGGNIPYLKRLFKTVGYSRENRNVIVMVTPRIIVNEEQAKLNFHGELPAIPRP